MSAKSLTIAVPESLLKQLRARARQAKHSVESEVVNLLNDAISDEESLPTDIESHERKLYGVEGLPGDSPKGTTKKTEQEYEQDWENAISQVPKLDDGELRKAVKPIMTPKQSERLAELNRKAQAGGLIDAEKVEQRELLHVYDKSMVVRAAVLAELNRRGFDVSKYVAP